MSTQNPYSVTLETSDDGGPNFVRLEWALRVAFHLTVVSLFVSAVVVQKVTGLAAGVASLLVAIASFEIATRHSPVLPRFVSILYRTPEAKHAVGNWCYVRDRIDAAWHEFDKTTREHPGYAMGWSSLAMTHYCLGDMSRCIECSNRALELHDQLWQALLVRGLARQALGHSTAALEDLSATIWQQPGSVVALHSRASVLHEAGESEAALQDLSQALKQHPLDLNVRLSRVGILVAIDRLEEAFREAVEVVEMHPRSFEAALWAAEAALHAERHEDTIDYATRAVKRNRRHFRGWRVRANGWMELGRYTEAIQDFERALRLSPKDHLLFNGVGLARHFAGDHRRALDDFNHAISLISEEEDVVLLNNRGLVRNAIGDYSGAQQDFRRALELDAAHPFPQKNWAWQLATCTDEQYRDGERAIRLATRAMELMERKRKEWLPILAAAHAEAGNYEKAIALQLEADPNEHERLELYRDGSPFRVRPKR